MKVLKQGTVPAWEEFKQEIICSNCKAVLELTADDLRPFYCYGTHFRHDYCGVQCPLCNKVLPAHSVPDPIKKVVLLKDATFDGDDQRIY